MVKFLLGEGAAIDRATERPGYSSNYKHLIPQGRTALHQASIMGHLSIVDYLLVNGASPELRDSNLETALCLAQSSISHSAKGLAKLLGDPSYSVRYSVIYLNAISLNNQISLAANELRSSRKRLELQDIQRIAMPVLCAQNLKQRLVQLQQEELQQDAEMDKSAFYFGVMRIKINKRDVELVAEHIEKYAQMQEIIFIFKAGSLRKHYAHALAPAFRGLYTVKASPLMALASKHRQDQASLSCILGFLGNANKKENMVVIAPGGIAVSSKANPQYQAKQSIISGRLSNNATMEILDDSSSSSSAALPSKVKATSSADALQTRYEEGSYDPSSISASSSAALPFKKRPTTP